MSDIGLNITVLDIFVYGVIAALPLTTTLLLILVVARLGIGHAAARRGLHWALNAGIIAVGPFWAIGAGLTGWLWQILAVTRDHLGIAIAVGDFVFAHPIPIAGRISAPDAQCNNCG